MYKVSAIVSTFKSERFIRGCLDDLMEQSLFKQNALEIVVVVSGSPENEAQIVKEYQKRTNHIVCLETERETMYGAWNRGVMVARGEYLTNANTDDRHRDDAIEVLARYLDANSQIDLVYSNCFVSSIENETFNANAKNHVYYYPRFFAPLAALHYQLGPHPMWRRTVHNRIGYFSSRLRAAGDFDFNLRFARELRAQRVDGPPLGLYLAHAGAISFKDDTMSKESTVIYEEARTLPSIEALYRREGFEPKTAKDRAQMLVDIGVRALQYFPPWFEGRPHSDPVLAEQFFRRALDIDPMHLPAHVGVIATLALQNKGEEAQKQLKWTTQQGLKDAYLEDLEKKLPQITPGNTVNITLEPSGLNFPDQMTLAFDGL